MIDASTSKTHVVTLTSAKVNAIVEALTDRAQLLRAAGERTPELNDLIDDLDALINADLSEDD
jgi:hypothetical protein